MASGEAKEKGLFIWEEDEDGREEKTTLLLKDSVLLSLQTPAFLIILIGALKVRSKGQEFCSYGFVFTSTQRAKSLWLCSK